MISTSDLDSNIENKNKLSKNKLKNISNLYSEDLIKIKNYNKIKSKNKSIKANKLFKFLIIFCLAIVWLLFIFFKFRKFINDIIENEKKLINQKAEDNYYKPILPFNKNEIIVSSFAKTNYNSSNIRYHFHDLFENRKIFKIN